VLVVAKQKEAFDVIAVSIPALEDVQLNGFAPKFQ